MGVPVTSEICGNCPAWGPPGTGNVRQTSHFIFRKIRLPATAVAEQKQAPPLILEQPRRLFHIFLNHLDGEKIPEREIWLTAFSQAKAFLRQAEQGVKDELRAFIAADFANPDR
jgi:hypothetical protein